MTPYANVAVVIMSKLYATPVSSGSLLVFASEPVAYFLPNFEERFAFDVGG